MSMEMGLGRKYNRKDMKEAFEKGTPKDYLFKDNPYHVLYWPKDKVYSVYSDKIYQSYKKTRFRDAEYVEEYIYRMDDDAPIWLNCCDMNKTCVCLHINKLCECHITEQCYEERQRVGTTYNRKRKKKDDPKNKELSLFEIWGI